MNSCPSETFKPECIGTKTIQDILSIQDTPWPEMDSYCRRDRAWPVRRRQDVQVVSVRHGDGGALAHERVPPQLLRRLSSLKRDIIPPDLITGAGSIHPLSRRCIPPDLTTGAGNIHPLTGAGAIALTMQHVYCTYNAAAYLLHLQCGETRSHLQCNACTITCPWLRFPIWQAGGVHGVTYTMCPSRLVICYIYNSMVQCVV